MMKLISHKDSDLLSQIININEIDIPVLEKLINLPPQILDTPHQKMLINNYTDANKGKIKGYFLEGIFGFCKSFNKVTKTLGFHLVLIRNDSQDFINSSMADDINVTIINLYLFIPNIKPSVETQLMSDEATQKNYKRSFDDYYTERRVISYMIVQHNIGSAQQVNCPKCLICAHQTEDRTSAHVEKINIAIFDNLDLRKYHVEIDSLRYLRDSLLMNYEQNDYIEQHKDLKFFKGIYWRTNI